MNPLLRSVVVNCVGTSVGDGKQGPGNQDDGRDHALEHQRFLFGDVPRSGRILTGLHRISQVRDRGCPGDLGGGLAVAALGRGSRGLWFRHFDRVVYKEKREDAVKRLIEK